MRIYHLPAVTTEASGEHAGFISYEQLSAICKSTVHRWYVWLLCGNDTERVEQQGAYLLVWNELNCQMT